MKTILRRVLVVAAALAIAGCSGNLLAPEPDTDTVTEVARLKQRIFDLEREAAMRDVETRRLRREIARLEGELESTRVATRVERIPDPPRVPPPPVIEEGDLDDRAPAVPPVAAPVRPSPPAASSESVEKLYDAGYTFFHQQRYAEAEERFTEFLRLSATGELSDNAQFWVGECRFARGDYRGALEAFTATVERYPNGNKVPDAMIKAGACLEALGDREGAIQTYREIQQRFRGTAAATRADERLAALSS